MSLGRATSPIQCLTPGIKLVVVGFTGNDASDPTGVEGRGVTVVRNGATGKYRITVSDPGPALGGTIDVIAAFVSLLSTRTDLTCNVEAIDETNRRVDLLVQDVDGGGAAAAFDLTTNDRCFCLILVKDSNVL